MSTRQGIVDAIAAALATVTGFDADHVHEWRRRPLQVADLPALVHADGNDAAEAPAYGVIGHRLDYVVEAVATGTSSSVVASALRTHVENVLAVVTSDPTWGGLAVTTHLVGVDMELDQSDRVIGAATISLVVQYETARLAI